MPTIEAKRRRGKERETERDGREKKECDAASIVKATLLQEAPILPTTAAWSAGTSHPPILSPRKVAYPSLFWCLRAYVLSRRETTLMSSCRMAMLDAATGYACQPAFISAPHRHVPCRSFAVPRHAIGETTVAGDTWADSNGLPMRAKC